MPAPAAPQPAAPPEREPEVVLRARGLAKRFGRRQAVQDLDLTVYRGDIYGFLGPNGAGKTTTIRMLLGLIRRDGGEAEILGWSLDRDRLRILAQVGALVEEPAFYPYLTGRQNLSVLGGLIGSVSRARIDEVLDLIGLADRGDDRVTAYSQGMRQRLGIGQALLMRPRLVFLDEPTNGLDPPGIESMRHLLRRLADQEKLTILVSSHLLNEVELLCNRVLIIDRGKKVVEGVVQEMLETDAVRLEIEVDDVARASAIATELQIAVDGPGKAPGRLVLSCPREQVATLNRRLTEAGVAVRALIPRRPTLEEFFRRRVEGQRAPAPPGPRAARTQTEATA